MKLFKFAGRRVMKTGIAVFITATVCLKLDLPVIFAVITAIVTTEPTALDSFRKGLIRLPAAAIGAGFALLFDLLLGQSPITFSLVAMLTILVCHHMKLDNGTLVATLTAVAMIPGSTEGLVNDFVFRLSGTAIGIIISTFVNFAVLPPKFGPLLVSKIHTLYKEVAKEFPNVLENIISQSPQLGTSDQIRRMYHDLEKAYQLSCYQENEWQYRKEQEFEKRSFYFLKNKLIQLEKIIAHISNINDLQLSNTELSIEEIETLKAACHRIVYVSSHLLQETNEDDEQLLQQIDNFFTISVQNNCPKKRLYYELSSILECLSRLQKATKVEQIFSDQHEKYPAYIFSNRVQYD